MTSSTDLCAYCDKKPRGLYRLQALMKRNYATPNRYHTPWKEIKVCGIHLPRGVKELSQDPETITAIHVRILE